MGIAGLLAGIFLPWIMGTLLLRGILNKLGSKDAASSLPFVIGYGFFVGYALLIPLVLPIYRQAGENSPLILFFLLFTGIIVLIWSLPPNKVFTFSLPSFDRGGMFSLVLAAIILIHLGFTLQQLLFNPILPWDAWSTWAYRAKMWYLSGPGSFVSPQEWQATSQTNIYAIDAYSYPAFVSLVYLWSAQTLGEWQESLLGLSWWFCSVAMVIAVYGHARWAGFNRGHAMLFACLLESIPLLNVHTAQQGYADLWMAGFSGLGLAALMSGSIRHDRGVWWLGLAMLLSGMMVKVEGGIWLLLGLVVVLLPWIGSRVLHKSATLKISLALLITLIAILLTQRLTSLPVLGQWGLEDGLLHLGVLGTHAFDYHPVTYQLLANMFQQGSWNIYWLTVGVILIAATMDGERRVRNHLTLLILGYLAVLILIFVFSKHAQWVAENTAFNRVALHLLPAMLLSAIHLDGVKRWASSKSLI